MDCFDFFSFEFELKRHEEALRACEKTKLKDIPMVKEIKIAAVSFSLASMMGKNYKILSHTLCMEEKKQLEAPFP